MKVKEGFVKQRIGEKTVLVSTGEKEGYIKDEQLSFRLM